MIEHFPLFHHIHSFMITSVFISYKTYMQTHIVRLDTRTHIQAPTRSHTLRPMYRPPQLVDASFVK